MSKDQVEQLVYYVVGHSMCSIYGLPFINIVCELGYKVNRRNSINGKIPLHLAVEDAHQHMCDILLRYGQRSDWLVKDNTGLCPFHYYRSSGCNNNTGTGISVEFLLKDYPKEITIGCIHLLLSIGEPVSVIRTFVSVNPDIVNCKNHNGLPAIHACSNVDLFK
jgi:ankyrin repeat protein